MSERATPAAMEIDPDSVERMLGEEPAMQLVDVREPYEREAGHIAGSRHVAIAELAEQASSIDRERPVVFYCRVGARSAMAAQAFRASGWDAYTMSGGIVRWASEGRPLAPDGGYVAEH